MALLFVHRDRKIKRLAVPVTWNDIPNNLTEVGIKFIPMNAMDYIDFDKIEYEIKIF